MPLGECVVCAKPGLWCNACSKVAYCSREHQKEDWKNHKHACKAEKERKMREDEIKKNSIVVMMDDLIIQYKKDGTEDDLSPLSMPKWVDTNSVSLNILSDDKLSKNDYKLTTDVISNMKQYGISACDNFITDSIADEVLQNVQDLYETKGKFKDGQTVFKTGNQKSSGKIRGDLVTWLDGTEDGYSGIHQLCSKMDTIISKCQIGMGNYRIVERTKAMVACYPGSGTGYKCHVDNPTKDGRCITCIYYLNKTWTSKDGGLLRIYPTALKPRTADIEPRFNRMLIFYSDKRNPHEVLPSYAYRFAITCWYFDQEERSNAIKTWAKDLKPT